MNAASQLNTQLSQPQQDNWAIDSTPQVLTKIFDPAINLAVLERTPAEKVVDYCQQLAIARPQLSIRRAISSKNITAQLTQLLPPLNHRDTFVEDLGWLVDMYAYLFDLEEVGLRLQVLDKAMCPRFHVDKLGCRLVTTYTGVATEWLADNCVDRSKLGRGSQGKSDACSGLIAKGSQIQQVTATDVVLLKGEGWFDNQGGGIVHRSPAVPAGETRLVATLDFA